MSQIDELRQIIVGENSEQLSELKQRIEDLDQRTKDVSEVLAPAIDAGVKQNDNLIKALTVPVSQGLKTAIRSEPAEYAEILYPVMAPSIRRAIAQAISSLMVTINQTVGSATSARGLSLRIKSWRTGVPYAQLALRESLLYRVIHLYLIDRESGMMIAECGAPDDVSLDSDAVSGMFSAIQSFVQDSFSQNEQDRLTDLKVGDHNVWVAHGRRLMLACVIEGDAPESLKGELYDALDEVRARYAVAIDEFKDDTQSFEGVEEYILPLLQSQLKESGSEESAQVSPASLRMLLVASAIFAYWFVGWLVQNSQLNTVEHYLKQTPGIAVTSTHWEGDKIVIEGLRDPDATVPLSIFNAHDIQGEQLEFRTIPFRSLETEMEMQRFSTELRPPRSLTFEVLDGKIWLIGEAHIEWLLTNDTRLRQLAADRRLYLGRLTATDISVMDYIDSRFSGGSANFKEALKTSMTGRPWTDVSLASLIQAR